MKPPFVRKLVIAAVVVIVIVGINFVSGGWIQNSIYRLTGGMTGSLRSGLDVIVRYIDGLTKVEELVEENEKLRLNNSELQGLQQQVTQLQQENDRLTTQLGVDPLQATLHEVRIRSIEQTALSSSLIINQGTNDGIVLDAPVIGHGNVFVGVISEVFGDTARVQMIDDGRFSMSIQIGGRDIVTTADGGLDGRVQVELISLQELIVQGDVVFTSGLDGLPPGLLVGTIESVSKTDGSLFQDVQAHMTFDPKIEPEIFVLLES